MPDCVEREDGKEVPRNECVTSLTTGSSSTSAEQEILVLLLISHLSDDSVLGSI